jgi:hypothetical protein
MRVPLLPFCSSCLLLSSRPLHRRYQNGNIQLFSMYSTYLQYLPTYTCAAEGLSPLNTSYSRDAAYPPAFLGHHEYIHLITLQLGHAAARC